MLSLGIALGNVCSTQKFVCERETERDRKTDTEGLCLGSMQSFLTVWVAQTLKDIAIEAGQVWGSTKEHRGEKNTMALM